jgi:DUF4097 and DUF4098 domain-containing protein YvlB
MEPFTYPTPGELTLELDLPAGDVVVETGERDDTRLHITGEVDDDLTVSFDPGTNGRHRLVVSQRRKRRGWRPQRGLRVSVTAPKRTRLRVDGAATDVRVDGVVTSVRFTSASGDVALGDVVESLEAKTASGDVRVGAVGGMLSAQTASGDVRAASAVGAMVRTASGDVAIGHTSGEVRISTASGDVELSAVTDGLAEVQSVSGDVVVAVTEGTAVYLDLSTLSGDAQSDLAVAEQPTHVSADGPAAQLEIRAQTVSGDIRVRRANG